VTPGDASPPVVDQEDEIERELDELVRRIEPRAAVDLRLLGHHNAATVIERIAAELELANQE
jgi:hypothetical protein